MNIAFVGVYTESKSWFIKSLVESQLLSMMRVNKCFTLIIGRNHVADNWSHMMEEMAVKFDIPYKVVEPDVDVVSTSVLAYSVRQQMVAMTDNFLLFNINRKGVREFVPLINTHHKAITVIRVR